MVNQQDGPPIAIPPAATTVEGAAKGKGAKRRRKPPRSKKWFANAERPEFYDPLTLVNLARSVELALLAGDPVPLAAVPPFLGAGVYAIYYTGPHDLYAPISDPGCHTPIYVGKAVPAGARKGKVDGRNQTVALWDRLEEHRDSIAAVDSLDVSDFAVRYLVTVEIFIPLAERVMIRQLKPVWNLQLDGFGNHDPGKNRRLAQQRPAWDELHPGRWWSTHETMPTPCGVSPDISLERIRAHLDVHGNQDLRALADSNALKGYGQRDLLHDVAVEEEATRNKETAQEFKAAE
ncbi:Eco29kI family restriction endonuclease [Micromonospora sp. NPDC049801]|uniref:Eco29kI family restriction endonuclease n=1 Tax=unclassified Micromonospora TaxID=2617518 RepID=UPI00340F08A6